MQTQTDHTFNVVIEPTETAQLIQISVDAQSARRRVTGWVMSEVANMLLGGQPELHIQQGKAIWRVPVQLTSARGSVGQVGTVDVDALSGALLLPANIAEQLHASAVRLAQIDHA